MCTHIYIWPYIVIVIWMYICGRVYVFSLSWVKLMFMFCLTVTLLTILQYPHPVIHTTCVPLYCMLPTLPYYALYSLPRKGFLMLIFILIFIFTFNFHTKTSFLFPFLFFLYFFLCANLNTHNNGNFTLPLSPFLCLSKFLNLQ